MEDDLGGGSLRPSGLVVSIRPGCLGGRGGGEWLFRRLRGGLGGPNTATISPLLGEEVRPSATEQGTPFTPRFNGWSFTTSGISYLSSVSGDFVALPPSFNVPETGSFGASGTSYRSYSVGGVGFFPLTCSFCVFGGIGTGGRGGGALEVSGISYLSSDVELWTEFVSVAGL